MMAACVWPQTTSSRGRQRHFSFLHCFMYPPVNPISMARTMLGCTLGPSSERRQVLLSRLLGRWVSVPSPGLGTRNHSINSWQARECAGECVGGWHTIFAAGWTGETRCCSPSSDLKPQRGQGFDRHSKPNKIGCLYPPPPPGTSERHRDEEAGRRQGESSPCWLPRSLLHPPRDPAALLAWALYLPSEHTISAGGSLDLQCVADVTRRKTHGKTLIFQKCLRGTCVTMGRVRCAPSHVVGIWGKLLLTRVPLGDLSQSRSTCRHLSAPAAYTPGTARRNKLQGSIVFFPLMIASSSPPPPLPALRSPEGYLPAGFYLHSSLSP